MPHGFVHCAFFCYLFPLCLARRKRPSLVTFYLNKRGGEFPADVGAVQGVAVVGDRGPRLREYTP